MEWIFQQRAGAWILLGLLAGGAPAVSAQRPPETVSTSTGMALIPAGIYQPPFRREATGATNGVPVKTFLLDVMPVTNVEFLEFVRVHPTWRRSQVSRDFAEPAYLAHWAGDLDLGAADPRAPVVNISWHATLSYAHWRGKRLPTLAEWEWAAAAGFRGIVGRDEAEFRRALTEWYSTPTPVALSPVGRTPLNFHGVRDLHGLVWEWVADFDGPWVRDSRGAAALRFCGAGGEGVRDPSDFPALMRYGLRQSLQAEFAVPNLGFRCAKSR